MMLMAILLLILLGVVAALLWPLLKPSRAKAGQEQHDMLVYREQLAEVENDIERGLLTKAQAEAVRNEIYRRMLAAEDAELAAHATHPPSRRIRKAAAFVIGIGFPVIAIFLYAMMGSPWLPGQPYAERTKSEAFQMESAAEKLQAEMASEPNAGGYRQLGDILFMMKRFDEAKHAYQESIGHGGGKDATTWSELGETVVFISNGEVTPEARDDFYKALRLDKKESRSRFYLGLFEAQHGDLRKAVALWKGLLKDSAPDDSWVGMVQKSITAAAKQGGFDESSVAPARP